MRTAYHEQLDELTDQLGEMCGLAGAAMERATRPYYKPILRWPSKSSPTTSKSPS